MHGLDAPRLEAQQLTASAILTNVAQRNNERLALLEHYTGDRTYHFEYDGLGGHHMAELAVHAEYNAPGRKHFTVVAERGSKPFCERVLMKLVHGEEEASEKDNHGQSTLSPQNYDATLVGEEQVDGVKAWVLEVIPRQATQYDYRGRIWVSQDDFGVMRVLGTPAKSPSWMLGDVSIDYRYERIGKFWLPAKNTSTSHVRLGGDSHMTISYANYEVESKKSAVQTATLSEMEKAAIPK